MKDRPSPNHDARPAPGAVDLLILHYTGMRSGEEALDRLCDPASRVSAHYLIDEDGMIWRLVDEARRAWHAGVAYWQDRDDINGASIGIELVNPGHEFGYRAFAEPQMAALESLGRAILARYEVPPSHVLGHSDVAPQRKKDPGEKFDWPRLARAEIGLWPDFAQDCPVPESPSEVQVALAGIGYACPRSGKLDRETRAVIAAFQRHYRPQICDGEPDRETRRRIALLARAVSPNNR